MGFLAVLLFLEARTILALLPQLHLGALKHFHRLLLHVGQVAHLAHSVSVIFALQPLLLEVVLHAHDLAAQLHGFAFDFLAVNVVCLSQALLCVLLLLLHCHFLLFDSFLTDHPNLSLILGGELLSNVLSDEILVDHIALHVGSLLE